MQGVPRQDHTTVCEVSRVSCLAPQATSILAPSFFHLTSIDQGCFIWMTGSIWIVAGAKLLSRLDHVFRLLLELLGDRSISASSCFFFFKNGPVPISYLTHHQTHFASQRSNETKITLAICPPDEDNPHQGDSVMGAGECAAAAAAAG